MLLEYPCVFHSNMYRCLAEFTEILNENRKNSKDSIACFFTRNFGVLIQKKSLNVGKRKLDA